MVAALDILASLLIPGAAVMVVTKMLQFAWQVLVVAVLIIVLLALVVVTLDSRVVVEAAAEERRLKLTIMVVMVLVTAQHPKVIAMADQ